MGGWRPENQTSLGVAPLEPATVVRAPFVIDVPVGARPRGPWVPTNADTSTEMTRPERTAMVALEPDSGMPRRGAWTIALVKLANHVRSVRWWIERRRTAVMRPR